MFGRKKTETEDRKMADASDDLGIPMKPARPMGPGANSGVGPANPGPNGPARPPTMPPRSPDLARAGETMAIRPAEPIRRPGDPPTRRTNDGEARKLTSLCQTERTRRKLTPRSPCRAGDCGLGGRSLPEGSLKRLRFTGGCARRSRFGGPVFVLAV